MDPRMMTNAVASRFRRPTSRAPAEGGTLGDLPPSPSIGPGLRSDYGPDYDGAYARDLDGDKVHFVFPGPA
jgi:hypothetical protein